MGGFGYQSESSSPTYAMFPGSYGYQPGQGPYAQSRGISNDIRNMIGQESPYQSTLQNALLNPQFGPQNQAETSLINSLMDLTAGRSAASGLGAPTQLALETSIAPTITGMQNQYIQQLLGGQGLWQSGQTNNIQQLLELLGYAMPQTIAGNKGSGMGFNANLNLGDVAKVAGASAGKPPA